MSRHVLVLWVLGLLFVQPVFADSHQVKILPESERPSQRTFNVSLQLETSESLTGSTPGLALRLCWGQGSNVRLVSTHSLLDMADTHFPAVGQTDSTTRCKKHARALGVPMIWQAQNSDWPAVSSAPLAMVRLEVNEEFFGVVDLWVERIGSGHGAGVESVDSFVSFVPDEVFEDRFQR